MSPETRPLSAPNGPRAASKPRLAFVSPTFLFPNDTGGKIRTSNILRGLKGGAFDVTLLLPASGEQQSEWSQPLHELCDRLVAWPPARPRPRWLRALDLARRLPVNVVIDRTQAALQAVHDELRREAFDVVVFDFVHSAVLMPAQLRAATVCFTHNVEAEIFARHATQARSGAMRRIWASQAAKMRRYELEALRRFTSVVAVSARDAQCFRDSYGLAAADLIPTGVDLDYFAWREPGAVGAAAAPTVVFTGSMDWAANVDGVQCFLEQTWPRVLASLPEARFVVVGRDPPASLLEIGRALPGVTLTGYVDDVRPHVRAAHVFVIPLRVGGGTRIKAFEAMAMGCPVVSTSIGIEGLDVEPGEHYLRCDTPAEQARAIVELLRDPSLRRDLSRRARSCVEQRFGHRVAAQAFEQACLRALHAFAGARSPARLASGMIRRAAE